MTRYKSWTYGFLAAGLALSLAAIGCGDDDTGEAGSGGSGGASGAAGKGGTGGTSGKGGTGGTSGKGGSGGTGGSTSPAVCKTDAMNATGGMVDKDCLSCACDADPNTIEACNKNAMCWPLISCVNTMCLALGMDATACAPVKCISSLGGAPQATPTGTILQGTCKAKCIKAGDAGVDAGF